MVDPNATRTVCLGAYVDLPLDGVMELLVGAHVDELLTGSLQAALGERSHRVELRTVAPERVTDHVALLPVTWRTTDRRGQAIGGAATVQLFVVQSGRLPVTELILTVTVPGDIAPSIAEPAHRALEELADRMRAMVAA